MARKRKVSKARRRRKGRKMTRGVSKFDRALCRLKSLKGSQKSQAIRMANNAFIRQFCNRIRKLKHAKLSSKQRSKLRKHRKLIKKLISKSTKMETRRKLLGQRGGFFPALLGVIPLITAAISAASNIARVVR